MMTLIGSPGVRRIGRKHRSQQLRIGEKVADQVSLLRTRKEREGWLA